MRLPGACNVFVSVGQRDRDGISVAFAFGDAELDFEFGQGDAVCSKNRSGFAAAAADGLSDEAHGPIALGMNLSLTGRTSGHAVG